MAATANTASLLLLLSLLFLSHAVPDEQPAAVSQQEQPALLLPSETAAGEQYSSPSSVVTNTDANPGEAVGTAIEGEGLGEETTSVPAGYIPVRIRFVPIDADPLGDLRSAGRRFRFFIPHHHHFLHRHHGHFRQMEGVRMGGFRGEAALMDENEHPEEGKVMRYRFRRFGMSNRHHHHPHRDLDGEGHMIWREREGRHHHHGGLMNRFWAFLNRF